LDVGCSPVALHFDGDHFLRFGKFGDPIIPVAQIAMNAPWSTTTRSPFTLIS